jgi:hypothetical protein
VATFLRATPARHPLQIALGQQTLEAAVLAFEFFETMGLRDAHAALEFSPPVEGGLREVMLAADFLDGHLAPFGLVQDGDNLLRGKLSLLHRTPPFL